MRLAVAGGIILLLGILLLRGLAAEKALRRGPLHFLVNCNRHLTLLTSVAVGAFVTRIVKESPLTPLPLPPLSESLRWNLVTVPSHLPLPFQRWTKKHPHGRPVYLNQGFEGLVDGGILRRSSGVVFQPKQFKRFPRHLFDEVTRLSNPVLDAAQRTLKPLKFIIPHAIGIKRFLHRLCG